MRIAYRMLNVCVYACVSVEPENQQQTVDTKQHRSQACGPHAVLNAAAACQNEMHPPHTTCKQALNEW